MKDHWILHGVRWVFLVDSAGSSAGANTYVNDAGATFGWRAVDTENTMGSNYVMNSGMFAAWPWLFVVRASDMQLVYEESDTTYLDIYNIAIELDTP